VTLAYSFSSSDFVERFGPVAERLLSTACDRHWDVIFGLPAIAFLIMLRSYGVVMYPGMLARAVET
jgi:hypothetical protein